MVYYSDMIQKESLTLQILRHIAQETAVTTASLCDVIFTDYHTSYKRLKGFQPKSKKLVAGRVSGQDKHRLYDMLSHLRRDQLVQKDVAGGWRLTQKGKTRLQASIARFKRQLPPTIYQKEIVDSWTILSYDIPEKYKRRRLWLRSVLKNIGFQMLHKSVWIGKAKIPENLILDLGKLNLLNYIEIIGITKQGTLRRLKA